MQVRLEWHELLMGATVGIQRQVEAMRAGIVDHARCRSDVTWEIHIAGALGELAAAKAMNVHWNGGVNTFKGADIGSNIQVRTRPSDTERTSYDLIVRPSDKNDDIFVMVQGEGDTYYVRGWISGAAAKQPQWLSNHGGYREAWFVPKSALHPVTELVAKEG